VLIAADNSCMALRWNEQTTLIDVQFEWEDTPTPRPVRLTSASPKDGDPVRVSMGGAEVEGVIVRSAAGVLHVRLAKPKMQKADARTRARRKGKAAG
jgi:hypothetical protein